MKDLLETRNKTQIKPQRKKMKVDEWKKSYLELYEIKDKTRAKKEKKKGLEKYLPGEIRKKREHSRRDKEKKRK